MRNTIILSVILFVAVLAASIYYFRNLDGEHNRAAQPLRYLPNNTLVIASIENNEATDNIFKDFEVFEALLGHSTFDQLSEFKTKLLRNESLKKYVNESAIYISFHAEKKEIETLLTIPTTTNITATELPVVLNEISKIYKITASDTLGNKIYQMDYGAKDSSLYAIYHKHIFFASKSVSLLTKILDKHTKHLPDEQIDFFLKGDSRNTALSIYFPHQQYDSIINLSQRKSGGAFFNLFKKMQGQSVWNINFKQDALMLTGESELDQYSENYVSLFKNQEKKAQSLYNYYPSNTAVYMEFSISNRSQFQKDLNDLFKRRKEKSANEIDTTGVNEKLAKSLGDDIALVETSGSDYLGFIRLTDSTAWQALNSQFLDPTDDSIYRFKSAGLLYKQFGDVFKELPRPYLTKVNDILVLANSSRAINEYRDEFQKRNLLTGTLGFKNFEKLQGNEANVTLFVHTKNANSKILNSLSQPFQNSFKDKENYGFQDFYSWSMQLSGNSGKFSSQLYAIFKSKTALGSTPQWTYSFENKAITRPYVFEHSYTSQFILIQELDHTIHAIRPNGDKLWSSVFAGRVVGDIQQLDDRSIVLVTDRNRLYRFDTDGNTLQGFSTGISEEPIATPSIVSAKGKKIILVPSKKKIHAFNMDGSIANDWQEFEVNGNIIGPVLTAGEHFAVGTSTGKVYLISQNGQKYRETTIKDNIFIQNPIGIHTSVNKQLEFLAVDSAGYYYQTTLEHQGKSFSLQKNSSKQFVDFVNINTTSLPELIALDSDQLRVYDLTDSAKVIFNYSFTKEINDRPQYFGSNTKQIGIASKATNLLYLFNADGTLENGFPVEGLPLFYYGKINCNGDIYLLCMRRDHKLYAFRHKKSI